VVTTVEHGHMQHLIVPAESAYLMVGGP